MGRNREDPLYILASQKRGTACIGASSNPLGAFISIDPDWRDLAPDYGCEPLSRRRPQCHGC